MHDLANLIIEIHAQRVRGEEQLRNLEMKIVEARDAVTTAKQELSQLWAALQIAVKRGAASPADLDAVKARLDGLQPDSSSPLAGQDASPAEDEPGEEGEDGEQVEENTVPTPKPPKRKLIDVVYEITQDFGGEEFTTGDVRRKVAEAEPELFATINPASVSGTLARIFQDYNQERELERVGSRGNEITYRRTVTPAAKENTPVIDNKASP
jgi:hypothetical protein